MKPQSPEHILYLCLGSKCEKKGAKECYKKVKKLLKSTKSKKVEVIKTECTDRCDFAPVMSFQPENKWLLEYKQDEVLEKTLHLIQKKS
ncbi:MAG TPA: (2Fe-2S) ferredoxin domain-containing protein [Pelobium sp.]|nr:(2Fe-2S) ferredoxin domain-containing protein [Pelobium sp.]